jgi:hypothetical protein
MANDSLNPRRTRSAATKRTSTTTAGSRTNRSARSSGRNPSAQTPNRQAQLRVPLVGVSVPVPPPDRAAFYAGLTVMTLVELIDWPVAVVIATGHALAARSRSRAVQGVAESAESA